MKKTKLLAGVATISACLAAVAAKDPVVMKVAGIDVPLSEFEYLYNKNNRQQVEQQTIQEYADIFKVYKQKVADALAHGEDTTATFRKEYEQYRHELAAPFLADSAFIEQMAREQYANMGEEVEAYHIMRFKSQHPDDNRPSVNLMDSLHNLLVNGADFASLAKTYSQDRGSLDNGGRMGYIVAGKFPYSFEKEVYSLKPGEISDVIETPMGYHILKGGARRPARGRVLTAHILKMAPESAPADVQARAKAKADSLALVLSITPEKFEELAQWNSDDSQSARNGGKLPWFGAGEMVEEFDNAAFNLQPGEISEPVKTRFGWHIIKLLDREPVPSYASIRPMLINQIMSGRDFRLRDHSLRQLEAMQNEYKGKYNEDLMQKAEKYIQANGIDSLFVEKVLMPGNTTLYSYAKETIPTSELIAIMQHMTIRDPEFALNEFKRRAEAVAYTNMIRHKEERLAETESEYRNLLREFRDGSLVYEAGRKRVWDRASQDKEGLNKYFESHRGDYKWTSPRVKGLLVQTANDSVSQEIRKRIANLDNDSVVTIIKKEFKGKAQVDRILAPKGSNPMVDYAVFGGEKATPSNSRYKDFFLYNFKLLEAPEEVNDVRGMVTADYQNQLEKEWVEELKSKYPVEVNDKVLKEAAKKYSRQKKNDKKK